MRADRLPVLPEDRQMVRLQPMFANLPEPVFSTLIGAATVYRVPARTLIFNENAPALDIYFVLEGWLKLYRITPKGDEAIVALFAKSQSIAEAVALTGQNYPATAETVTDCRLMRIPAPSIIQAIKERPDIALAMVASVSVHLHRLLGEVTRLKAGTGLARMVAFLADLDAGRKAAELTLPFEKHVLARHLGMQPESLSRTLRKLEDFGVSIDARRVRISSWEALTNDELTG